MRTVKRGKVLPVKTFYTSVIDITVEKNLQKREHRLTLKNASTPASASGCFIFFFTINPLLKLCLAVFPL
jgi:hypothetical protein